MCARKKPRLGYAAWAFFQGARHRCPRFYGRDLLIFFNGPNSAEGSSMSVRVRSLHIYPVKSCAGIDLQQSAIDVAGLAHDRRWLVLSGKQFLTQRQLPAMALVVPTLTSSHLRLDAPGMATLEIPLDGSGLAGQAEMVTVWGDTFAARAESEVAARWFSDYLGRPCRVFKADIAQAQRAASAQWVDEWLQAHADLAAGFEATNLFGFADGFPLLVTNQASLDELNGQLAAKQQPAVPMNRFRPNIVLEGEWPSYDEDHTALVCIGDVRLALVKPCTRCSIPDVDQATGIRHDEPGFTLMATRSFDVGVVFGENAIVSAPAGATLRVGDSAEVELDF
jgi:uncharacterized protein YcbX